MTKYMNNKFKEVNFMELIGIILMLAFSFLVPVFGLVLAIITLIKFPRKSYSRWIQIVAIAAIVFQLIVIATIILNVYTSTEQIDSIQSIRITP